MEKEIDNIPEPPKFPNDWELQPPPEKDTETIFDETLEVDSISTIRYNDDNIEKGTGDEEMEKELIPKKDDPEVRKMCSAIDNHLSGRDIYFIMKKTGLSYSKAYPLARKYLEGSSKGGWKTKKYIGLQKKWEFGTPPQPENDESSWDHIQDKGWYPSTLIKEKVE